MFLLPEAYHPLNASACYQYGCLGAGCSRRCRYGHGETWDGISWHCEADERQGTMKLFYIVDCQWELFPSVRDPKSFDNFVINFTIIISGSRWMPLFSDWVPSKYSVYGNLNFSTFGVLKENLLSYNPAVNTSDIWKMFIALWKITSKVRTHKLPSKPQAN